MGVNANGLRFLLRARRDGVKMDEVAMIGRQGVHVSVPKMREILNTEFGMDVPVSTLQAIDSHRYAEPLLELLGARKVVSYDFSDYEGATFVHDFNTPIDPAHDQRYDMVIDGGTLEHVFNFPVALKNCMRMIRRDGVFIGVSSANNELGHGFYQFSPELYFRAFDPRNGYRVDELFLHEGRENRTWIAVQDPDAIRQRATLINTRATLQLVRARREDVVEIFSAPPLQSDYSAAWAAGEAVSVARDVAVEPRRGIRKLFRFIPVPVKRQITMFRVAVRDRLTFLRVLMGVELDPKAMRRVDSVTYRQ